MFSRFFRSSSAWTLPQSRLRLRPMSRPDLRMVRAWFAEPDVLQLAFGTDMTGEALEMMGQEYLKDMDASRQVMLTVETLDLRMVGFVRYTLFPSDRGRTARVGIVIGERTLWNQGYGTEAMQLFLSYLFQKKSVEWIELDTAHFNARAQRCFDKCGFRITATDPLPPDPEADQWGTPKVWMELHRELWKSTEANLLVSAK